MNFKTILGAASLLLASGTAFAQANPFALPTTVYNVSVDKSLIYVVTRKDTSTAGSGLSHNHAVQATVFSGTVGWNNGDASKCKFDITVQVSGLVNDAPNMRRTAQLDDDLSEDMRAKVKKAMMADDQLDLANHPTMTFKSTDCASKGGGMFDVKGDLMIRGQSTPITVPMQIKADGNSLGASGSFKVNGTAFGMKPKSAMAGQIKNLDELQFHVSLGANK